MTPTSAISTKAAILTELAIQAAFTAAKERSNPPDFASALHESITTALATAYSQSELFEEEAKAESLRYDELKLMLENIFTETLPDYDGPRDPQNLLQILQANVQDLRRAAQLSKSTQPEGVYVEDGGVYPPEGGPLAIHLTRVYMVEGDGSTSSLLLPPSEVRQLRHLLDAR